MERLKFNSDGKLIGVDDKIIEYKKTKSQPKLRNSDSLEFLKPEKKLENIFDKKYWSLYEEEKPLSPLKFSNNKTQEDIVEEIVKLIKQKNKIIFLHGVCGTGKSAIALNIARSLGKSSIVVPIKSLQAQYELDYMGKKQVLKPNGKKLKIAMITGRENHDSIIEPGKSCADPFLPDTIKLIDKNQYKLREFYKENPFISSTVMPQVKDLKRISIAPANPYWSPIIPAEIELNHIKDATKKKYKGMYGKEFVFYHRKEGCSYYDQYLAYLEADVIIFNSAKYLTEIASRKKPETEVDIIDEADEFLDSLSNSIEINLTRLGNNLRTLTPETEKAKQDVREIIENIDLEEKQKRAIGIKESEIYKIEDTKILNVLKKLLVNLEIQNEIELDETNYAKIALDAARDFNDSFKDTYLTFRKEEEQLYTRLVTTNLSQKFNEIVNGNKSLVLMSGTLHSETVLKNIFGIEKFSVVEAEILNQGAIEIHKTGKEIDCRYSNFSSGKNTRAQYLNALSKAVLKSKKPTLIHVNAFADLPTSEEASEYGLFGISTKDELYLQQKNDKNAKTIKEFKEGKFELLFTTKCSRGIDFPGSTCNSIVFTKYPNANVKDTFWKILEKTHPNFYWEFYKDKAKRDFLQRIYRAVRSKDDHVFVLSPDSRVLDAVRDLQVNGKNG